MTATVEGMSPPREEKATEPAPVELEAAREMVRAAKAQGMALTGPNGLLKQLTKTVVEVSLEEEMADHLGYSKHEVAGRESGNSRNGTRTKTVITDNAGPVQIEVPRDRNGTFEPVIVAKHQRRLNGVDEIVLSLTAKGLTTGEISAHFAEIYGASVSKETVSRITDRVVDEMHEWMSRPLDTGVVSGDRCESACSLLTLPSSHRLVRGLVMEAFAGPVVELVGDPGEFLVGPH